MEEVNLKTTPNLAETVDVITGLSDHTLGSAVSIAAVALGAKVIEKHFILNRDEKGPDAAFSMEPKEFKKMVEDIRNVEKVLGKVTYELTEKQKKSKEHSRSLFVVKDIKAGEIFTDTAGDELITSVNIAFIKKKRGSCYLRIVLKVTEASFIMVINYKTFKNTLKTTIIYVTSKL